MTVLHVVFQIGAAEYALPASEVIQMESFSGATPVPGTASYVAGIVQIRGRVVPVIDARKRFGQPTPEPNLDNRVVVVALGERVIGLLVDRAREVVKIDPADVKPPPPALTEQSGGYVRAVAQVAKRLLLLIDVSKVVSDVPGEEKSDGS
jgi:purine-binding chemotaxis protein CheW